jgi:DNA-binding transcriptional MerR regulator
VSFTEILEELPKLTQEQRQAIYRRIEDLDGEPQFEATEEMRAAIDQATRSLEAGKGIPLEEVRQRFLAKWAAK